jgi:hypothetical protein
MYFGRASVVEVAVRDGITDVRDVALDERYERDARRRLDVSVGIQAVLDSKQARDIGGVLSGTAIHNRSLGKAIRQTPYCERDRGHTPSNSLRTP